MSQRHNFRDNVADFLRRHPNQWIPAQRFESIGGRMAWRTRLSDCRTELGMTIENRVARVKRADGSAYTTSEYRWVPSQEPVTQLLPLGA